jgi:hypothetical protein
LLVTEEIIPVTLPADRRSADTAHEKQQIQWSGSHLENYLVPVRFSSPFPGGPSRLLGNQSEEEVRRNRYMNLVTPS